MNDFYQGLTSGILGSLIAAGLALYVHFDNRKKRIKIRFSPIPPNVRPVLTITIINKSKISIEINRIKFLLKDGREMDPSHSFRDITHATKTGLLSGLGLPISIDPGHSHRITICSDTEIRKINSIVVEESTGETWPKKCPKHIQLSTPRMPGDLS